MPADDPRIVVLVHGWSVRSTDTYGGLPARLESEAGRAGGLRLDVRNIWLSKYVSFSDAVRVEDISRAFEAALQRELGPELARGRRFACITHSTGGPVVRDWWHRYHKWGPCPLSHLIMLAPANFGSALAQLGKSRVSRLKAWFEGVEPGEKVLDWLELGSPESWALNQSWVEGGSLPDDESAVFPFVLTGQSIDRSLFDHLNTYTGELGSDGVVRAAAANLNATYVRLEQEPAARTGESRLRLARSRTAPRAAFALIPGASHSGDEMGILRSVRDNGRPHPTVRAVLDCLRVANGDDYLALCDRFDQQTETVRQRELVETRIRALLPDTTFIHDTHSMVIFRVQDDQGAPLADFDLKLLASKGRQVSPDFLPAGFLEDKQRNRRHPGTMTFFFNHAVMVGSPRVPTTGKRIRDPLPGAARLGLEIVARPGEGFVHYLPAQLDASAETLAQFLKPDQTTLVDVVARRVVRQGVFRMTRDRKPANFTKDKPGEPLS